MSKHTDELVHRICHSKNVHKMKPKIQIKKRMEDILKGVNHDMAPVFVQTSRVSAVMELNWVLGNPIDPDKLDALWHEVSGLISKEIK